MDQYFRANVGAVILNADGMVLALERSDVAGAWQLPQGGLHVDEEPPQAVFREVQEETGLEPSDLTLLGGLPDIVTYELPVELRTGKTGRGQAQYWFFLRLAGGVTPRQPPPPGEFRAWKWMRMRDLVAGAVSFRRAVYQRLADYLEQDFT